MIKLCKSFRKWNQKERWGNSREKIRKLENQKFQRKESRENYQRSNLRNFPRTEECELPV